MNPMLNIGIRAARAAGKVITQNIDRFDPVNIEKKQRNDFVTEVDRKAEAEIVGTLQRSYPDHAFLCEESGLLGDENAEYRWVIDPLDGTMNFIHGLPHFSVSIALLHHGRLFQAVIYDPMRQELFTAGKGEGAFLDSKTPASITGYIAAGRMHCSGTGFPYRDGQDLDFYQRTLQDTTPSGLQAVCAVWARPRLDLAYVAAGRIDGVLAHRPAGSWDMAAGALTGAVKLADC